MSMNVPWLTQFLAAFFTVCRSPNILINHDIPLMFYVDINQQRTHLSHRGCPAELFGHSIKIHERFCTLWRHKRNILSRIQNKKKIASCGLTPLPVPPSLHTGVQVVGEKSTQSSMCPHFISFWRLNIIGRNLKPKLSTSGPI